MIFSSEEKTSVLQTPDDGVKNQHHIQWHSDVQWGIPPKPL